MYGYYVSQVAASDVEFLLKQEGIKKDGNLDYTCAVFDNQDNIIATGSAFGNTLRCFAVSSDHRGENLLNMVMSHMIEYQTKQGVNHLFVYTKASAAPFFKELGFCEIERVGYSFVFMENQKDGFKSYIENLTKTAFPNKTSACVVMNANPFTNGHKYLLETASKQCDVLHLFVVSEDKSLFPLTVRKKLIEEGTKDIKNIVFHESGPYIISNATFPSYFLKDEDAVVEGHAKLDAAVFVKIAKSLNITKRFVGYEKTSKTTEIYNQVLSEELPKAGIDLVEIARLEADSVAVSASTVRQCIKDNNWEKLKTLVPVSTFSFLKSEEAKPIIDRIKEQKDVIHH